MFRNSTEKHCYSHVSFVIISYFLNPDVIFGFDERFTRAVGLSDSHHTRYVLKLCVVLHSHLNNTNNLITCLTAHEHTLLLLQSLSQFKHYLPHTRVSVTDFHDNWKCRHGHLVHFPTNRVFVYLIMQIQSSLEENVYGTISYHFFIVGIERLFNYWEFLLSKFLACADQTCKLQIRLER